MRRCFAVWVFACALFAAPVGVQAQTMKPAKPAAAPKVAYYFDPMVLDLPDLIANPPAVDSPANNAELAVLHQIEATRTPGQIAAAKADEDEEDMFAYKTVLGAVFNPDALPITAELGVHVKNEQSVAGGALKAVFAPAASLPNRQDAAPRLRAHRSPQLVSQRPRAHRLSRRPDASRDRSRKAG